MLFVKKHNAFLFILFLGVLFSFFEVHGKGNSVSPFLNESSIFDENSSTSTQKQYVIRCYEYCGIHVDIPLSGEKLPTWRDLNVGLRKLKKNYRDDLLLEINRDEIKNFDTLIPPLYYTQLEDVRPVLFFYFGDPVRNYIKEINDTYKNLLESKANEDSKDNKGRFNAYHIKNPNEDIGITASKKRYRSSHLRHFSRRVSKLLGLS